MTSTARPVCTACGGDRLTAPTRLSDAKLLFKEAPLFGVLASAKPLSLVGRACLGCGHVMVFLAPEALEAARKAPRLDPV